MPLDPKREVAIGLLPQDWDVIFQGLGQLPYFQVVNLIAKIRQGIVQAAAGEEAPEQE